MGIIDAINNIHERELRMDKERRLQKTPEEARMIIEKQKIKSRERSRKWRQNNPEKARIIAREGMRRYRERLKKAAS